jgi:hypothetical protein
MSTAVIPEPSIEVNQNVNPEPIPIVPICEHIKDSGHRCGTPAIRGRHFCYHHSRAHAPAHLGARGYRAPVPETIQSLQLLLMQVTQALGSGRITDHTAGKLLYAVQLSSNLLKMSNSGAPTSGAPSKTVVGLSGVVNPSTDVDTSDHQITSSPDELVTDIPEAMEQALTPPPADDPSDEPLNIGEPVPIPPATWKRLTADILTMGERESLRACLLLNTEHRDYQAAMKLFNAHHMALATLHEFGMSPFHPKLRPWFPRVPSGWPS